MSYDGVRLTYVMHGGLGGLAPTQALARWPDTPRLLSTLAARADIAVTAIWRIRAEQAPEALERDGIRYVFVPDHPRVARRVAAAVRASRPDVVHVNGLIFPLPTLVVRGAVGRHVRLVVQHHGELPGRGRARLAQTVASRLVDAHLFTGGSGQAAPWRKARVLGRRQPVFDVLEASTDLGPVDRARARSATGVHGRPAVVWVGRLIADKDPLTALRGFERLVVARAPDAHLWMICADRTQESLVAATIAASEQLRGRVTLVGPVPHDEMAAWLSAADVFLSTSRHEGSGYALIEAMACGCPPVVSDIPSHRAIAGPEGERFPAGDASALGDVLGRSDWGDAERASVRAAFERRLTWTAVVDGLLAAYGGLGDSPIKMVTGTPEQR